MQLQTWCRQCRTPACLLHAGQLPPYRLKPVEISIIRVSASVDHCLCTLTGKTTQVDTYHAYAHSAGRVLV